MRGITWGKLRFALIALAFSACVLNAEEKAETSNPPKPLTPEEDATVEKAIKELGDEDFSTRAKAQRELEAFGIRARPAILQALEIKTQDAERKVRLQDALEKAIDPAVTQATKKLLQKQVSFEFVDTNFKDAVEFIHSMVDKDKKIVFVVPEAVQESVVTLKVKDMAADQALIWVCRLTDLEYVVEGKYVKLHKANP